jgi:hypothetical protein
MSNPITTQLSINEIQKKLDDIQTSVTKLQTEINRNLVPKNTQNKIGSLKHDLESILDTINKISGVNSAVESYINSLVIDMTNQSFKDSFYTVDSLTNTIISTQLLKAEIKMIRQLSTNVEDIKEKFKDRIGTDADAINIKKAIKDADNEIDIS